MLEPELQNKVIKLKNSQDLQLFPRWNDYEVKTIIDHYEQIVSLSSWKGKDSLHQILQDPDDDNLYQVIEKRKTKESDDVQTTIHKIKKSDVDFLLELIKRNVKIGAYINSTALAELLITDLRLGVSSDAFWGGQYRAKYYFPKFYYPLKILDYYLKIRYNSNGRIERLE